MVPTFFLTIVSIEHRLIMKPRDHSLFLLVPRRHWQVLLEVLVPCGHAMHEFLPFWDIYFFAVGDNVYSFMAISILTFWPKLIVLTCRLVTNVAFDAIFFLYLSAMEKILKFECCYESPLGTRSYMQHTGNAKQSGKS